MGHHKEKTRRIGDTLSILSCMITKSRWMYEIISCINLFLILTSPQTYIIDRLNNYRLTYDEYIPFFSKKSFSFNATNLDTSKLSSLPKFYSICPTFPESFLVLTRLHDSLEPSKETLPECNKWRTTLGEQLFNWMVKFKTSTFISFI